MAASNQIETITINFKIHSKSKLGKQIELAVKQIDYPSKKITITKTQPNSGKLNEFLILDINHLEDHLIDSALQFKEKIINEPIIITESQNPVLLSTLSRLGLNRIFVFPFEIQKFKAFLESQVNNLSVKLLSKKVDKDNIDISDFGNIIGKSTAIKKVLYQAKNVAINYQVDLLILGETGTGKGLLSRSIHNNSPLADNPFVAINCSAIPENLLESELFGYEQGAFTDARARKLGLFEIAKNGTIFLDEIGDLSLHLQVKILDVLDNRVIRRLGGTKDIPIKARIISATNRDLLSLVEQKLFRRDLYHRLEVVTLRIPPLRERGNDILLLANHFLEEASKKFNKPKPKINAEMKKFLLKYPWPGNIRELRNAIERAVLLSESEFLQTDDLFNFPKIESFEQLLGTNNYLNLQLNSDSVSIDELVKRIATHILNKFHGNKSKTAEFLHISRPRLDRILK